ncbi:RsmD family RNA methyltransferase, partial [Streptomyces sp. NPDC060205]
MSPPLPIPVHTWGLRPLAPTAQFLGGPLAGERVLDLYAGSGAVGLEALS